MGNSSSKQKDSSTWSVTGTSSRAAPPALRASARDNDPTRTSAKVTNTVNGPIKQPLGGASFPFVDTRPHFNIAQRYATPPTLAAGRNLPQGWETRIWHNGQPYYLDHNSKTTQWQHPRARNLNTARGDTITERHNTTRWNDAARGNDTSRESTISRGNTAIRANPAVRGKTATRASTATRANATSWGNTTSRGNTTTRWNTTTSGNTTTRGNITSRGSTTSQGNTTSRGNTIRGKTTTRGAATTQENGLTRGNFTARGHATMRGSVPAQRATASFTGTRLPNSGREAMILAGLTPTSSTTSITSRPTAVRAYGSESSNSTALSSCYCTKELFPTFATCFSPSCVNKDRLNGINSYSSNDDNDYYNNNYNNYNDDDYYYNNNYNDYNDTYTTCPYDYAVGYDHW